MLQKEIVKAYEHQVRQQMEAKILEAAQTVERQVEKKLKDMEDMSSSELDKLRDKRLKVLKKDQNRKKRWQAKGRGTYEQIDESEFFEQVHKHSRIVVHFVRRATERCKILDVHLKEIAGRHPETLFLRIDVEKSPFLAARLGVKVLPCMKLVKQGEVIKTLVGFEDFGNRDDFRTVELVLCLARCRIIQPPPESALPGIDDSDGNMTSDEDDEVYDSGGR